MSRGNLTTRFALPSDLDFVGQDQYLLPEIVRRKIEWREIIVAEVNDGLAGYLRLEYLWAKVPYIALIRVLPEYRGQGVGKALLMFVEEFLRAAGQSTLYSSSQANEAEAQAWHRHAGFEECGIINGINEDGIGEVFFRKEL
jgi:ribosomal protein S18 acetylase RimI-like enzyme